MTLKHYVKGRCNNPHEAAAAADALYSAHHPYGLLFCKKSYRLQNADGSFIHISALFRWKLS